MSNVFILYMPPGNAEAMVHYQDTIVGRVSLERLKPFIPENLRLRLESIFHSNPLAVWGSEGGPRNRSSFERMTAGDDILIVEGDTIRMIGKVAAKTENAALSRELWKPLSGKPSTTWELIYFIANSRRLELPFVEFCRLFGYATTYRLRGFTSIAADKLQQFHQKYDDLYSILVRMQDGRPIEQRKADLPTAPIQVPSELAELSPEQVDEALSGDTASDHIRMQWKLARLGIKAGERIWVPTGDQTRIRKYYEFDRFDTEFTAGIDLPHSYVENIDVVWKQEFRIGAAYEVENSTSIYSGLLRFADLNILAPNTLYPMFVVAPAARKNRLRDQLRRPTFRKLGLDQKVRFLSYENIDQIDEFFASSNSGLNIETIVSRGELLAE